MRSPFERFQKSITKDNLWIYVLTLLKKGEMYPYEIRREVKECFGFMPGNVTAYIVLKKLEAGGYVKKSKTEKGGGPLRGYYRITERGKEELKKAVKFYRSRIRLFV